MQPIGLSNFFPAFPALQSPGGLSSFSPIAFQAPRQATQPAFGFGTSPSVPQPSLLSLMSSMMQIMLMMFRQVNQSNVQPTQTQNPLPAPTNTGAPTPTNYPTGQTDPYTTGAAGAPIPPPTCTPVNNQATAKLNMDDLRNYVLAGSQGGTKLTTEGIYGRYADPASQFANAGGNEFDAVIAKAYAAQFKAHALGLPAAFIPGQTTVDQVANNINTAQNTQFTPEAELLSQVAAVYRGDFGSASLYNNGALKNLLTQWGRSDIANQPGVGDPLGDVQSIGGVIKALNEEPDQAIRKAWLQQIFDFQNNTPNSPSGAVPQLAAYQTAISIVKGGVLDRLIGNYQAGIKTTGAVL